MCKSENKLFEGLLILVVSIFLILMLGTSQIYAGSKDIGVFVDGNQVVFDQAPVVKDGRTLVPVRAIFEGLGIEVEWDATTKKIVASNKEITINLQVGSVNASVGNEKAGYIETTLDVAPQNINGRVLVPVRFIGEASGSDVAWDSETKSVIIKTVPERKFISSEEFKAGYERFGYAIWETNRSFEIQGYSQSLPDSYIMDGFGKENLMGDVYIGMYKNNKYNGYGTLTMGNGEIIRGNYTDGEISNGEYIFAGGVIYKGPIEQRAPHGKGVLTYQDGNTQSVTYVYGEPQKETDPNKPYDSEGNLILVGDTVKKVTLGFKVFVGQVTQVNANQVQVSWYDVCNMFDQSLLSFYKEEENQRDFLTAQFTGGITFNMPQWVDASDLRAINKSGTSNIQKESNS